MVSVATVHDLYTSVVLQGLLANPNLLTDYTRTTNAAIKWVDAMVEQRIERIGKETRRKK